MSLVPCKRSSIHQKITLENLLQGCRSSLGIRKVSEPKQFQKNFVRPYLKRCRRIVMTRQREGAILIFSPGVKDKLMELSESSCREYFDHLVSCKTALLIFAQCRSLPTPLKRQLERHHLRAVVSSFHENLLESRIKAIIREKIRQCVTVHGVVLEFQGQGILITGPSGIGKTTTAIQIVDEGYVWIADDLAVIRKNQRGQLIISGHRKIQNYFHTEETGIMAVDRMLKALQIKQKSVCKAWIELVRTDADGVSFQILKKNILETSLSCLQIKIPRTGYLDKNLLKKATQQINRLAASCRGMK